MSVACRTAGNWRATEGLLQQSFHHASDRQTDRTLDSAAWFAVREGSGCCGPGKFKAARVQRWAITLLNLHYAPPTIGLPAEKVKVALTPSAGREGCVCLAVRLEPR